MPSTTILISLGILVVSYLLGVGVYLTLSKESRNVKKKQVETISNLVINFIIYIWLAKILVNLPKFVRDPLSILAYPSNALAFYVATAFLAFNLWYLHKRKGKSPGTLAKGFLPIFLSASFFYEFLQLVVEKSSNNMIYLVLVAVLMLFYIVLYGRVPIEALTILISLGYLIGTILCIMFMNTTVFGYRLSPLYFIGLLLLLAILALIVRKRKV